MQKYLFPILAGVLLSFNAFSQKLLPAKIIANQQDTSKGFVEKPNQKAGFSELRFTDTDRGDLKTYTAEELQGIVIDNVHYLSAETSTYPTKVFLQAMVIGQVTMLSDYDDKQESIYYFQKDGGKAYKLDKKHASGFLTALFNDCKNLKFNQKKEIYTRNELMDATVAYNNCQGDDDEMNQEVAGTRNKITFSPGIRGLINSSRISNESVRIVESNFAPGVNLFLNIDFGSTLSLQPEVSFTTFKSTINNSISYELTLLQFPVVGKYKLTNGKLKSYLAVAPQFNAPLKYSVNNFDQRIQFNIFGFAVGGGFSYSLNKVLLNIEYRYTSYLNFRSHQILFGIQLNNK